jgi:hypothetical protein
MALTRGSNTNKSFLFVFAFGETIRNSHGVGLAVESALALQASDADVTDVDGMSQRNPKSPLDKSNGST